MQRLITHLLSVIFGIVCLSSCVTSRKVNYWQEPDRQIPSYTDTLSYEDYLLRKGDRLYIYVHSIDERITQLFNSGNANMRYYVRNGNNAGTTDLYSYVVDDEGNITFPTVGTIPVLGKTTREVKHELESLLSGQIKSLADMSPFSVDVQVIQRFFSIIGANSSGRFAIPKEKITIFEALALAGDIADFGGVVRQLFHYPVEDHLKGQHVVLAAGKMEGQVGNQTVERVDHTLNVARAVDAQVVDAVHDTRYDQGHDAGDDEQQHRVSHQHRKRAVG